MTKYRLTKFIVQGNEMKSSSFHGEGWPCWLGEKKPEDFTRQKLNKLIHKRKQENIGLEREGKGINSLIELIGI